MTSKVLFAFLLMSGIASAHNSYTGNYSGSPGHSSCASSCHGGSAGTATVSGFPATYVPGQNYTIILRHNGGARIVNFNATTRLGSTTTVAGTFAAIQNATLYTGADGGVYASPHSIDSVLFRWTAPATGSGTVNFYLASYQGTTSSSNGQSTRITLTATESTTEVRDPAANQPEGFWLAQNYPNPFNPSTTVNFSVPRGGRTTIRIFNALGAEVATILDGWTEAGLHSIRWNAAGLTSGIYFMQLQSGGSIESRKLILMK
jgi:hypothetical protein